jgi:4-hydroxy-2-oxoheptanedioate aldolase
MGPFLKCPYPEMVECCALSGFDFAIADMEHTPISQRDLLPLLLAAKARGIELVVRIPENLPMYFKWCLDLGFNYIQVPHIHSKEDAQKALNFSRFAPGERGLCRFVRAADYSNQPVEEYMEKSSARLILQIEGVKGVAAINEILTIEGLDTVFIGPYDLSQSMGHPGQIWHPEVTAAMSGIVEKCSNAGVRVGTFADSQEGIFHWVGKGVQMIQYASDLNLFFSGARALQNGLSK